MSAKSISTTSPGRTYTVQRRGESPALADGPSARAGDSPRRWTVYVRPGLVVEIDFADMRRSRRCPGGGALRFVRVVRYREDNRPGDVDTIQTVQARKMESMLETRRAFV